MATYLSSSINSLAGNPEHKLPLTHATSWANFISIAKNGYLRPSLCPVFGEKLVYFFCGAIARRASDAALPWGRSESPVILVFNPSVVECINRIYPMDTGALAAGRLGETIYDFRTTLRIDVTDQSTPWRFISAIYGTNDQYFMGNPRPDVWHKPGAFDSALSILTANMNMGNVDYRRFSIECQTTQYIPLDRYLYKVCVPAERVPEMSKLANLFGVSWAAYDERNCPQFFTFERQDVASGDIQ